MRLPSTGTRVAFTRVQTSSSRANPADAANVTGWAAGHLIVETLRKCGDDLTRENVMRQAAYLYDLAMLVPGIRINTSPTRFYPVNQQQMARFDGKSWVRFGELPSAG